MAASTQVFSTYELLEEILLYLPLRQLLLSQKINKAAFDVVQRSSQIQRTLFLIPNGELVRHERGFGNIWKDKDMDAKRPISNPFCTLRNVRTFKDEIDERKELLGANDSVLVLPKNEAYQLICRRKHHLRALGSKACMMLIYSPVEIVRMDNGRYQRDVEARTPHKAITYGDLIESSTFMWTKSARMKKAPITLPLWVTSTWLQFEGSIDTITAVEMLDMLSRDPEDLLKEGRAFREEEKGRWFVPYM